MFVHLNPCLRYRAIYQHPSAVDVNMELKFTRECRYTLHSLKKKNPSVGIHSKLYDNHMISTVQIYVSIL